MNKYLSTNAKCKLCAVFVTGIVITFFTPFLYLFHIYWFLISMFFVMIYWIGFIIMVKRFFENYFEKVKRDIYLILVRLLRVIRHDFTNYFQVIHSLAELNQKEKLNSYLKTVNYEISKLGSILKLHYPELSLFFLDQLAKHKKKDIEFQININTNMEKIKGDPDKIVVFLNDILKKIGIEKNNVKLCSIEWEISEENACYPIIITVEAPYEPWREELDSLRDVLGLEVYSWESHLAVHLYIEKKNDI